jgi:hypothetical protein
LTAAAAACTRSQLSASLPIGAMKTTVTPGSMP